MWSSFLHHLTLHFPIVLSMVLAVVGLWSLRADSAQFRQMMRVGGWICFALTTVAAISGIAAAPGWFGGDGSAGLAHHRSLGVTAWALIAIAAFSYEWGVQKGEGDWRKFAVGVWCLAVFAVVGAGHWGGTERHPEELPWTEVEAAPR